MVLTCLITQECLKKKKKAARGRQEEVGVISHPNSKAKDGGVKNNNGRITEVEEVTGGT